MSSTNDMQPGCEKMKKTLRWISETLLLYPNKTRKEVIREAELRFDLTPLECEFLNKNFAN
ncbi:MAG: hypothetical protein OEY01_00860 [Desulfobulbaceae bacterium]|nr:hypothetical protein [Desulfobulbaceae bacterium]HIJ77842.1 hypothetical protein [Deltaproteobacteria bacterium]